MLACLCLGLLASPALAERACPPRPCDLKKDGRTACEAKASWVLEGTIQEISDTYSRDCTRFGDTRECLAPGWKESTITLGDLTPVKMPFRVLVEGPLLLAGYGKAHLTSANSCWEDDVRVPLKAPRARARFYGMQEYPKAAIPLHGWPPYRSRERGYFAFEFVK
jgi:hypothetical protein